MRSYFPLYDDGVAENTESLEPLRLVKLRLQNSLIRAMDAHIVASRGMYRDRNDFIAEAIWDRINEDVADSSQQVTASSSAPEGAIVHQAPPTFSDVTQGSSLQRPAVDEVIEMMVAQSSESVDAADNALLKTFHIAVEDVVVTPRLTRRPVSGIIFGLHNRDLPTLWVTAELAVQARADGEPVAWATFVQRLRSVAQSVGHDLRALDRTTANKVN